LKVVNCKTDICSLYIGRPSKWGNPYTHIKDKKTKAEFIANTREEALFKYREWIEFGDGNYLLKDLHELVGKTLGCWCKPKSCHGDILIELVNKYYYGTNIKTSGSLPK